MTFSALNLSGAFQINLEPKGDERGAFTRLFCADELKSIGLTKPIVNINHSYTRQQGTIRGMHFQYPPDCEIKIISCSKGIIWDCIVDIRKDSPTFLQWTAVELSAKNNKMIYVPEGFAHGFQSLTDDVEMLYFHTAFYNPKNEGGLCFDDPALAINWPLLPTFVSEKDRQYNLISTNFQGVSIL